MPNDHIPLLIIAGLVFLLPLCAADAAMVEHHGFTVESEGAVRDCLSCHDGVSARNIVVCSVKCTASTTHSVLKPYPSGRARAREFQPLAAAERRGVKTLNGMVTCISCHNLKNQRKNHLVMENTNSRLCLACHIK